MLVPAEPKRLLVITADDLGIDPRRDDGIFAAHRAGGITQASLMVAGPSAPEAARRARNSGLTMGLHLDLSEMPPVAAPASIPTLLNRDGGKRGKHGFRLALAHGWIEPSEVAAEAEAQLDRFVTLTGRHATHVDGHQHVHWTPQLASALAPVFARKGVHSVRTPLAAGISPAALEACDIYRHCGVRSTHGFVGVDPEDAKHSCESIKRSLSACPAGASVELMSHVGYVGTGGDDFNRSPDRERELHVLCALPFFSLIDRGVMELVTFDDLYQRGALC